MINISFLDEYSVNNADISALRSLGNYTGYDDTSASQVVERCSQADVVITNKVVLTRQMMEQLPRLKLICVAATGMNNIDLAAATDQGIAVRNAVNYSTYSVAEATLAGVLALIRQTAYNDQYVKSGQYASSERLFHFGRTIDSLHGKRWGIIGLGNIGRQVASVATAFGARVSYYSTSGANNDAGYPQLSLGELLQTSDIVSVHSPLNERTLNLLDYDQLASMKPSALIANFARGGIVNEAALARCIDEGVLAGAAVDVFSREPIDPANPLLSVRDKFRLVLSPHNAWSSVESNQRLVDAVTGNIRNYYSI